MVISEIYPAPQEGFEWVELCNDTDTIVSLGEYVVHDAQGKQLTLPAIQLAPQQYVLATSSSVLNNSGDSVTLKKGAVTIEKMTYSTSLNATKSLVFCDAWITTDNITPGFENPPCTTPTPTLSPSPSLSPTPGLTDTSKNILGSTRTSTRGQTKLPSPQIFSAKHVPISRMTPTSAVQASPTAMIIQQPQKSPPISSMFVAVIVICIASLAFIIYKLAPKIKDAYNGQI